MTLYKPGEKVPRSGIYRVAHDSHHVEHEVTCVWGDRFPPCNHCGMAPRFVLVRSATHVANHKQFKR